MAQRSEQLRREAEQTRAQLAETLEELRTRITPGQVVDQLVDYAGHSGAGQFFRNLSRQAVNNPLPVTLMGAGLAWLMLAGNSSSSRMSGRVMERGRGLAGEAADTLGRWGAAARETSSELKDRAADWASQSAEAARASVDTAAENAKDFGASVSEKTSRASPGWQERSGIADESMALWGNAGSQVSGAADEAGSAVAGVTDEAARAPRRMSDKAASAYGSVTEKTASAYGAMSDKAESAYERMGDKAASAYGAVSDKAASAYEDASVAAARAAAVARDRAQAMTQSAADASRSLLDFCKEQPLVLAGLGLALGAALGAAMPATRTENELMGETSDQLKEHVKERAHSLATEQYEKAKSVAEHAYEETKAEAEKQDLAGASELAQAPHESVPTAPSLSEEAGEGEQTSEPWHGRR